MSAHAHDSMIPCAAGIETRELTRANMRSQIALRWVVGLAITGMLTAIGWSMASQAEWCKDAKIERVAIREEAKANTVAVQVLCAQRAEFQDFRTEQRLAMKELKDMVAALPKRIQ